MANSYQFLGFKKILSSAKTGMTNNYLYFVRESGTAVEGELWFNGTCYGKCRDTEIDDIKRALDGFLSGGTVSGTTVKEYIDNLIDNLDYDLASGDSSVLVSLNQTDGKVSAATENIVNLKITGYQEGSDADVAATDTLGQALGKLQGQINAMDKTASAVDGQVVTTVTQDDGKVTETKANVKDLQLGGYAKDATATGDIASTDTINAALSKLENKAAAITIANADGSINVSQSTTGTDINVNIKSGEKVLAKNGNAGLYTDIKLSGVTPSSTAVKEEYALIATDGSVLGEHIKVYKDSHIVSITYITDTGDTHYQNLEYVYIDASGETKTEYVDISSLVLEAEFASGVGITNHVAHGVVDPATEKDSNNDAFLTVGADGFKVDGIKDEIVHQISLLDVTDAEVAGQYVSAVNETDGKVTMTRANVSEAVLNNYSKGTDSSAVTATDTVNQAISKLENQIDKAIDDLDYTGVTNENTKVVTDVKQENGLVSASATTVGDLVVTAITTADTKVAANDSLATIAGKLQGQINAMDLAVVSGTGAAIVSVSEEDGKVNATTGNIDTDHVVLASALTGTAVSDVAGTQESTVLQQIVDAIDKSLTGVTSTGETLHVDRVSGNKQNIEFVKETATDTTVAAGHLELAQNNSKEWYGVMYWIDEETA